MNKDNNIFWYETSKGVMRINLTQLYRFLNSEELGMVQISNSSFIIKKIENIIEVVDGKYISQLLISHIRAYIVDEDQRDRVEEALRNKISKIISKDQLMLLNEYNLDFVVDTKDACNIFYRNEWIWIEANKVENHPYLNLDGVIWASKKRDRDIRILESGLQDLINESEFAKFIWNVANKDSDRFDSLCSILGYLVHEYKDSSINKAVIFMDESNDGNPEGGTGKGIVMTAIGKVREAVIQDGKNFTFNTRFAFQDIKHSTSILVFDDAKVNFDLEKLFSVITDGINVEEKGKDRFRISKDESPKILINTNYVIKGKGNSHERRRCEFEFSQHYNGKNTPFDEFNHQFFEEWDSVQWNLFDNFIIRCVQHFLDKGLISASSINLEEKRIEAETSPEFVEFISTKRVNRKYNRNDLQMEFRREYPDINTASWYTNRIFVKWIRIYAEHKKYTCPETRSNGDTLFQFIDRNDSSTVESQAEINKKR